MGVFRSEADRSITLSFSDEEREAVRHTLDHEFEPFGFDKATNAMPGSWEKICVLERRVQMGVQLWHPSDPTCFTPMVEKAPWANMAFGKSGDFKSLNKHKYAARNQTHDAP